jgi:hypothetical protein
LRPTGLVVVVVRLATSKLVDQLCPLIVVDSVMLCRLRGMLALAGC